MSKNKIKLIFHKINPFNDLNMEDGLLGKGKRPRKRINGEDGKREKKGEGV